MSKWDGKSKGTVLGYKIFVFLIQKAGVKAAYVLLYFVASYYFLFLKKSNKAISYYFKERLGYSWFKSKKWSSGVTTLLDKPLLIKFPFRQECETNSPMNLTESKR